MLGWSINLFRVFGIQLAVHASFFLLPAYFGYVGWTHGGAAGLCWNVAQVLLFFVCVILHELGHSLTALRFGVRVPRILLLPIGGMAEFDRIPRKSSEELWITIAGPAVNFALFIVLLPFCARNIFADSAAAPFSFGTLITQLCVSNLAMGIFNLIPVFPMDGGRIFRALLALKLPYLRATYWAVVTGRVLAVILISLLPFFDEPWENKVMVAVLFGFIFWVGGMEYRHTLRLDQDDQYWAGVERRLREVDSASRAHLEPPQLRPASPERSGLN